MNSVVLFRQAIYSRVLFFTSRLSDKFIRLPEMQNGAAPH